MEIDDFVVEGHTVKDVHLFENPDDDDVVWARQRTDMLKKPPSGSPNLRRIANLYQGHRELWCSSNSQDELLADETPDVTVVPNGVEDAGWKRAGRRRL